MIYIGTRSELKLETLLSSSELQNFLSSIIEKNTIYTKFIHQQKLRKLDKLVNATRTKISPPANQANQTITFADSVINLTNVVIPKDELELL